MREKILMLIERNAKLTAKEAAVLLGEDEEKVAAEIKKMEEENIICGYHTMINWNLMPEEKADAIIEVKVAPQRGVGFDRIAERIWQYPEVEGIYLMSGSFDFAIFLQGKSMREVAMFVAEKLSTLDSILSTSTQFVLKKYKDHGVGMAKNEKDVGIAIS